MLKLTADEIVRVCNQSQRTLLLIVVDATLSYRVNAHIAQIMRRWISCWNRTCSIFKNKMLHTYITS